MAALNRRQVRKLARRAKLALKYERMARARGAALDEATVVYESFSGNGMLCNPEAIFRELLAAPDLAHLKHVWVLSDLDEYASTVAEFADDPRVSFVEYDSIDYYGVLGTAKYLVNNATFPPQFGKREGQVYLNTWHGTPLKAMGYDIPGGAVDTRNVVRNLVNADYLMAGNEATAEMYLSAYRMRNIYRGAIVHAGTPRIDRQFGGAGKRAEVRALLRRNGVAVDDDQQILLYAPTWKGNFYSPTNDTRQLRQTIAALTAQLDTRKYRVLLKVHQQIYKFAIGNPELRDILVPNEIPANDVLAATDAVITDYSSIFVDFLATGRPVLFYTPDLDDYESSRGLYLPVADWPGPVSRDVDELAGQIKQLGTGGPDDPSVAYARRYAAARERYCALEDGHAAQRLIDIVFRGRSAGSDVRRDFSDGRTSVLIHLGGMIPNGITTSGLCLLDNIDYERFDVSVTYPHTVHPDRLKLVNLINPNVRHFPRIGGMNGPKLRVRQVLAVKGQSATRQERGIVRHADLLRDEWRRCFGDSEFDHVVDFSGYAPFWIKMFTQRGSGSLSIWLHNDMQAEAANTGRNDWLRASVEAMAKLYSRADHLVSVSAALAELNKKSMQQYAAAEKFTYARNTINYRRILHLAYGVTSDEEDALEASGRLPSAETPPVLDGIADAVDVRDLRGAVDRLIGQHGITQVADEVDRRATIREIVPPAGKVRTLITAGRLSPEKNHERLLRAFDLVHQDDPDTRLVILGSGPLKARLADVAEELGLTPVVAMPGHLANPYGVLANSDCFVLSSDYEGQPMVLLEALVLGLPVVSTRFGSAKGALPKGYGKIVPRTVEGLAEGMQAFLSGEVKGKPFDYAAYNRDATEEFYRAIGAT